MSTVPNHLQSLKEYFKKVDYSSWERSSRRKEVLGQKTEAVPWALIPQPKAAALPPSIKAVGRGHGSTASSAVSRQPQADRPESAISSRSLYSRKKNIVELDPTLRKGSNIKVLELLIKLRKKAIDELEAHCAFLQESNQQLTREIEETGRHSFSSARESLIQHEKLGHSFAALNGWSCREIEQAKAELKDVQVSAEKQLHGLQEQLKGVDAEVLKARDELHTLRTYKDVQYPVKLLKITEMKRELEDLKDTLKDERDRVAMFCQEDIENFQKQSSQDEEDILASAAKRHLSYISPMIQQMATRNYRMTNEIEMYKKEVKDLEEKNQELISDIQELQLTRKNIRKEIFYDVFLQADKCSPDMDVMLNIPREEWLPI
ncbi:uncharacterized protein C20orf96 homolog [Megalops cyprinoides]|uniref:uncharacterized protein C20orf96 homolog n=1 Tax=Megalops cyprinoides TaxID=118141 RepID=UPI00186407B8|nr:uncharacterized protein C20orf96 homolog [Megalops cyprinoides]